jgi:uncharacterized protein YggU (UPF0235/DUF167 family)
VGGLYFISGGKIMNGIRINTGAKKIQVNDEGDFITLNFGDQSFPVKVFELINNFQEQCEKLQDNLKDLETEGKANIEAFRTLEKTHLYFKEQIDNVFGAETCRKVFGNITPSMEHIADFFHQIEPFFTEYGKERQKTIKTKYAKPGKK